MKLLDWLRRHERTPDRKAPQLQQDGARHSMDKGRWTHRTQLAEMVLRGKDAQAIESD